jgi:MFS family permease
MFGVAGIGNAVYHPADYALLSHHVPPERAARAYSIHTFAGMLGSTAAPASLLLMQSYWGWRGAFVGAAVLGLVVALILIAQREEPPLHAPSKPAAAPVSNWKLLTSAPIMLNLLFFVLLALMSGGLQNYSVVALEALRGAAPVTANAALTGFLLLSAIGVLAGGVIAGRTVRHNAVAMLGMATLGVLALVIATVNLGDVLLIVAMSLGGFFNGSVMPSRDMIVREITPPGAFGKVFGFVTTGFNIGGIIAPLVFGLAMDHGEPQWVFLLVAVFCLLALPTLISSKKAAA